MRLIRRNPVACAEKMKANKPMEAKEAFTAEEVKRMMDGLPHDKYGDSIRLMLGTGIRMQELLALEPRLTDTLTEKQKELFEDYMAAQREVNVLTDCETFIYAFRLAAKIMIDVLTEGQMREI